MTLVGCLRKCLLSGYALSLAWTLKYSTTGCDAELQKEMSNTLQLTGQNRTQRLLLSLKSEIFPYSTPDRDQSLRIQKHWIPTISGHRIGLMKRRKIKIQVLWIADWLHVSLEVVTGWKLMMSTEFWEHLIYIFIYIKCSQNSSLSKLSLELMFKKYM